MNIMDWRECVESCPGVIMDVLAWREDCGFKVVKHLPQYVGVDGFCRMGSGDLPTHWTYLPEPPSSAEYALTAHSPKKRNLDFFCCLGCSHPCPLNVNNGYCAAESCQYKVQTRKEN